MDSMQGRNMSKQLLEIQPGELKFEFELKKQSICSIRLVNNSLYHVAFKVKTTSPKKYSVRPNVGVIKPVTSCDFIVTMQAQRSAPPDMVCKDKFLVQSTVVPAETTDEDITPSMFDKNDGKYVEENKLRVILVNPSHSPVLSPINGIVHQGPAYEAYILKDHNMEESKKIENKELKPNKDAELKLVNRTDVKPENDHEIMPALNAQDTELKPKDNEGLKPLGEVKLGKRNDVESSKSVKLIEDMKSKLSELESKLTLAQVTISKLTEERRSSFQGRKNLEEELAMLKSKKGGRRVQEGFPLLFVCMVALISMALGYILNP